jgi:hypothetical protein
VLASYQNLSYEELLESLVYVYEAEQPFTSEKEFSVWFKKNYNVFGFKRIIQESICTTPDFIMEDYNGTKVNVELELTDEHFWSHEEALLSKKIVIDYVVAAYARKNEMFGVPILSLKHPLCNPKITLNISDELWNKFKSKVPKTKTMNQAVVELIEKEVELIEKEEKKINVA